MITQGEAGPQTEVHRQIRVIVRVSISHGFGSFDQTNHGANQVACEGGLTAVVVIVYLVIHRDRRASCLWMRSRRRDLQVVGPRQQIVETIGTISERGERSSSLEVGGRASYDTIRTGAEDPDHGARNTALGSVLNAVVINVSEDQIAYRHRLDTAA